MPVNDNQQIYESLRELRGDIKELDNKLDVYIASEAVLSVRVKSLCSQVELLNRLLVAGNGQKSVLVQLENLNAEVSNLNRDLVDTKQRLSGEKQDTQAVSKQRWIAVGKFVGLISLAVPGILSLLGFGG